MIGRARDERGVALVSVLAILIVVVAFGAAILTFADSQQRAGGKQQQAESAFALAEAALNAQVFQLSLEWPTKNDMTSYGGFPTSCNAASGGTSYCPQTNDMTVYSPDSNSCTKGTPGDAWNSSSAVSDGWTTYVRDAGATGSSTQSVFTSSTEQGMSAYDSSGTGYVWVRAVGIVHCQTAIVVAKVAEQVVSLNFPNGVLNANGFEISNSGNKEILNTQGSSSSSSSIGVRCTGKQPASTSPNSSDCTSFAKSTQIQPSVSYTTPASPTLSSQQLTEAKQLAIENGTYFGTTCPTTGSDLGGQVVYVAGPCNITISSNGTVNSASSPGLLIIVNGTINFTGSTTFYGAIYDENAQGSSGDVVTLGGNTTVIGGIDVDGNGTVNLGSSGSGSGDLQYSSSVFGQLDGFAGAAQVPNTFTQLPITQ
jgi:Tfp pilus assembly protein PilX